MDLRLIVDVQVPDETDISKVERRVEQVLEGLIIEPRRIDGGVKMVGIGVHLWDHRQSKGSPVIESVEDAYYRAQER